MAELYTLRIGFKGRPNPRLEPNKLTNPEKHSIWRDWGLQEEKFNKAREFIDKHPEIAKTIAEMGVNREDVSDDNENKSFIETYNPQRLTEGRDLSSDSGDANIFYNLMGLFDSELNVAIYNYYKQNGGLEN